MKHGIQIGLRKSQFDIDKTLASNIAKREDVFLSDRLKGARLNISTYFYGCIPIARLLNSWHPEHSDVGNLTHIPIYILIKSRSSLKAGHIGDCRHIPVTNMTVKIRGICLGGEPQCNAAWKFESVSIEACTSPIS